MLDGATATVRAGNAHTPKTRRGFVVAVCVAMAAAGCANAKSSSNATIASALTGSLTVFAAASLTESFGDEQKALHTSNPALHITYNFAGSQALVTQITQGAAADVIATADPTTMGQLVSAGLVDPPTTFARNRLEIAVAPGNPKHVVGLVDLARSDLIVVLPDPTVPAGRYGQQILKTTGVTIHPQSLELDVKSALAKVTTGAADATIVYTTDVTAAGTTAAGVEIPDAQNVIATYPVATLKAATHRAAAVAYVAFLMSAKGRAALTRRGFLSPT